MFWNDPSRLAPKAETVDRDAVANDAVANEIIAGPSSSPVVENVVVQPDIEDNQPECQPGLVLQLLARVAALETRVDALEKPLSPGLVEQLYTAPVNQVIPPTGALVVKGIHYRDAVCDECQQVHDGTGRTMDTRGKLIKNPKPCRNA
jgi:hypothetical protein